MHNVDIRVMYWLVMSAFNEFAVFDLLPLMPSSILEKCFFFILKCYRKVYFSDTETCQCLHLFPLCDVM